MARKGTPTLSDFSIYGDDNPWNDKPYDPLDFVKSEAAKGGIVKARKKIQRRVAVKAKRKPTLAQSVEEGAASAPTLQERAIRDGYDFGESFDDSIEAQGGWGLSPETRKFFGGEGPVEALRPVTDVVPNLLDLGYRGLQTAQGGFEAAAKGIDYLSDRSGLSEALSSRGAPFRPGSAAVALAEAFPSGVDDVILRPRVNARSGLRTLKREIDSWSPEEAARASDAEARMLAGLDDAPAYTYSEEITDPLFAPPVKAAKALPKRKAPKNGEPQSPITVNDPIRPAPVAPAPAAPVKTTLATEAELLEPARQPDTIDVSLPKDTTNINTARLNTTEDVRQLINGIDVPETRSISQADTRARADELNLTEEDFLKNRGLEGLEAYAVRSRDILKTVAEDVFKYLDEGEGLDSPNAQLAIARLGTVSEHLQNTVNGPAGRILNSFKIGAERVQQAQTLSGAMATSRGRKRIEKLLKQYRGDPDALAKIARDAVNPGIMDRVLSFRYNMMLSGPKTHVYNILGTAGNQLFDVAEHGLASVLGLRRKWSADADRVAGREVSARIIGSIAGAQNSLAAVKQAFKEGRPLDDASRAETHRGRVGGWELPVKAMAAEDEFFRSVASMSDTYGMAVRKAKKEGLTGDSFKNRVDALIQNPTKDMLDSSKEYAKRIRFQDDPSVIGKAIEQARIKVGKNGLLSDARRFGVSLLMPFVRTPDSLIRTALRRSPLGVFDGVNIADWKAGGARRDLAVSRVALGSGVTAFIASKVLDGEITGEGPRDYKKKQALEMTGWQANSFKVGDKYYSYEGLEPFSLLLSGTATTMERFNEDSEKELLDKAASQTLTAAEIMTNSSYLEGLSDLFGVFNAPEGQRDAAMNNFFANITQSFVIPAAVRQVNQTYFDPVTRDTRGDDSLTDRIVGRIQSGIPGLSDELPAQLDALGREIGKGDALGPDILSRMSTPLTQNSEIATELARLGETDPEGKFMLERVDRSVNTKDFPMGRLNAAEHHDYQLATGAFFTELMKEEMASPEWKELSDDEKRALVKDVATDARKFAREEVFGSGEAPEEAEEAEEISETTDPIDAEEGEEFVFGIPTSMRRTVKGNAAVGGVPDSMHISGDAIDFVPADGVSWKELYREAKKFFGPDATVIHEYPGTSREHVHVELEGLNAPYYGARGVQ